jgi:hypothetical protein
MPATTTPSSLPQVWYFIEKHTFIGKVSCTFWTCSPFHLSYNHGVVFLFDSSTNSTSSGQPVFRFSSRLLDQLQVNKQQDGEHRVLTISWRSQGRVARPPNVDGMSYLSASEIQAASSPASYRSSDSPSALTWSCHHCKLPVPLPKFPRIRDLPSTYWYELVDCWSCHHEDTLTHQLGKKASSLSLPEVDTLLVGSNFLLLRAEAAQDLLKEKVYFNSHIF